MTNTKLKQLMIALNLMIMILAVADCPPGQEAPGAAAESTDALQALDKWLLSGRAERPSIDGQKFASTPLSRSQAEKAKKMLW